MIPIFPKFKKISRNDREEILARTKSFLPYSDYNFNSLWSWDTTGHLRFSDLNGNLVVMMPDYITSKNILSYVGIKKPKDTVETLLDYSEKKHVTIGLKLVPEVAVNRLVNNGIHIKEDRNNFDYLFSTKKLADLKGREFKVKRHLANRFKKQHPEAIFKTEPLSDPQSYQQVLEVLKEWESTKKGKADTQLEHKAIRRILKLAKMDKNELMLSGIYFSGELLAFSIDEILSNGYGISHFYKIKSAYKGVSEYLNQETAQYLYDNGVELWNWEQDLGIEGLRKSKTSYRPVQFLKKYIITKS